MSKSMVGNLLLTLTAFIWGVAFVAQRAGMDSIEPITFTAARMGLAAVTVSLVCFLTERKKRRDRLPNPFAEDPAYRKNTIVGGIICGIFLVSASIFQQIGVVYTTAGKAGFITAMYMLLVPVINYVLFRKKNSWLVWFAVMIGVAGMYLLCMTEGFSLSHGDTMVCICAVLFSGHILCCDHFAGRGDPIRISIIQFITVTVISGIIALIMEEPSWRKIAAAGIPILYCGIMSAGVGYTLQMFAQRYTDPTIASLLMSLESVFAAIAGAVILHERMSGKELAGCVIMFIAIILVQLPVGKGAEEGTAFD